MTITLVFASKKLGGKPTTRTVNIASPTRLKEVAKEHGVHTLTACEPVNGGYGAIGDAIPIEDDSEQVPLPIQAMIAVNDAIDEHKTTLFMVN